MVDGIGVVHDVFEFLAQLAFEALFVRWETNPKPTRRHAGTQDQYLLIELNDVARWV